MATPTSANTFSPSAAVLRVLRSEYLVLLLAGLYFVALAPFTPGFLEPANFTTLLITLLPLFLVAIGQTMVLITGGIDLSQTSVIALCSIAGAAVMSGDHQWLGGSPLALPLGLVAMALVGAAVGACNGLAVTRLAMPPFIVTLTSMMFFSGLAIWLTRSQNIGNLPAGFNALGSKLWLALPFAAVLAWLAHTVLSRSLPGRWLYATGHNSRAAHISGVPVKGVVTAAYIASGMFAAAGSVLYTAQAETGSPVLAQRLLLDVVGATVIGGTSLFGGKGRVLWTLWGVLFIKLMDNSLNLLDLSYFTIMMVKGAVILLAAFLDALRNKVLA